MKKKAKEWKWSFLLSGLLHLTILGLLFFQIVRYQQKSDSSSQAAPPAAEKPEEKPKPPKRSEVKKIVDDEEKRVAEMKPARKMRELRRKLPELEKIDRRNVNQIANIVEGIKSVDKSRAWEPVAGVKGKFESNSAVLYDIRQENRDGRSVYVHVMVDRDGRTLEADVPEEDMTNSSIRAYKIFKMSKDRPNLKRLLRAAIRIGDASLNKTSMPQTAK